MRIRKGKLMNFRTGLSVALGLLSITAARAAVVRPGAPQLLDPSPSTCAVPATFAVGGVPTRVLFLAGLGGVGVKWDGQPVRVLWPRAQLQGGARRAGGVFRAINLGVLECGDG